MLMEIIDEINEKKEKEENFYAELKKLESMVLNIHKSLLPQVYSMLGNDYLYYDELQKAFSYYMIAFDESLFFIQNNVLDTFNWNLHINLILDVIIHIIEIVFDYQDVILVVLKNIFFDKQEEYVYVISSELMSNEELKDFIKKIMENESILQSSHHKIFIYLTQKYLNCRSKVLDTKPSNFTGLKYLNYALLFVYKQEQIDEVIEMVVNIEDIAEVLSNIKRLIHFIKIKILLLFLDRENYDNYLNQLRISITNDNNREILQNIVIIGLKIGNIETLSRIFTDLKNMSHMFFDKEVVEMLYSDIYKVFTNKATFILEFVNINKILSFWYLTKRYDKVVDMYKSLLEKKKNYFKLDECRESMQTHDFINSRILEMDKHIIFVSLFKMGYKVEASKMYQIIIDSRNLKNSFIEDEIFSDVVTEIEFLLTTDNKEYAIHIVKSIRKPRIYVDLINMVLKFNKKDFLLEIIKIGIEIFGTRNTKLLQIFVSFLHIKEYKIEEEFRLEIITNIHNIKELSLVEREWFYKLIYNNIIDIGFTNNEIVTRSLEMCYKLVEINKDLIYISLLVYRNKVDEEKVMFLYEKYIEICANEMNTNKQREIDIFIRILFYEYSLKTNNNAVEMEMLHKLNINTLKNNTLLMLMELSSPYVTDTKIIMESYRRKILTKLHIENNLITCSIRGNIFLFNFLKTLIGIDVKKYLSKNSLRILRSQLYLTKIIGNQEMYIFFKDLLNDE